MEVQGWLTKHSGSVMTDPGTREARLPRLLGLQACLLAHCSPSDGNS